MGDRTAPLAAAAAVGAAALYAVQQLLRLSRPQRREPPSDGHLAAPPSDGAAAAAAASSGSEGQKGGALTLWSTPPHPDWRPPQKQPVPFATDAMHTVDPASTPSDVLYPLVISAVVPRPIAFVSTLSAEGVGNLAPYSYFNAVAHNPPHVAIGFCSSRLREHGRKDSLVNILETGEFVLNVMSEWFIEAANHCCGNFDYGEDEMQLSGLTPLPSLKVRPPRVKESAVHMECALRHTYEIKDAKGEVTTTVVIGEVLMFHVHEGVAGKSPSGKLIVDISKYQPMSRLGGNTYGRVAGLFDLPRPDRGPAPAQKELQYSSTPA